MAKNEVIKMRMSFVGVERNALRSLKALEAMAKEHDEDEDHDDDPQEVLDIETCIEVYHDALLALCKGLVTVEQVRAFFFSEGECEKTALHGKILRISEDEPET